MTGPLQRAGQLSQKGLVQERLNFFKNLGKKEETIQKTARRTIPSKKESSPTKKLTASLETRRRIKGELKPHTKAMIKANVAGLKAMFEKKGLEELESEVKEQKQEKRPLEKEIKKLEALSKGSKYRFHQKSVDLGKKLALAQLKAKDNEERDRIISLKQSLSEAVKEFPDIVKEIKLINQVGESLSQDELALGKFDNFDIIVSKFLIRHGVTDRDINLESLFFCGTDNVKAKLKIAKRLGFYLQGGILPAEHSPSRGVIKEQTKFPASVIKAAEQAFKHQIKDQTETKAVKVEAGKLTYTIIASKDHVFIEEKYLAKGEFKMAHLGTNFFEAKSPEDRGNFVTLRAIPKDVKEKTNIDVKNNTQSQSPSQKLVKEIVDSSDEEGTFFEMQQSEDEGTFFEMDGTMIDTQESEINPEENLKGRFFKENDEETIQDTSEITVKRMKLKLLRQEKERLLEKGNLTKKEKERLSDVNETIDKRMKDIKRNNELKKPTEEEIFEHEINMLQKFNGNAGIVPTHKIISQNGGKVIIQEAAGYQRGNKTIYDLNGFRDLNNKVELTSSDKRVLFQVLYDVCSGLETMHENESGDEKEKSETERYIHRDIKSGNILVSKNGRGWITDMGTVVEEKSDAKCLIAGTPSTSPPEAYNWLGTELWNEVDCKWDVWSFGIVMMSLCVEGKTIDDHPIFADISGSIAMIEGQFKSLQFKKGQDAYTNEWEKLIKDDPNPFLKLVYECTKVEPDDRPSMSEVKRKFKELVKSEGIKLKE